MQIGIHRPTWFAEATRDESAGVRACRPTFKFACLSRLKTFLTSILTQKRLHDVVLLHFHSERSDLTDRKEICKTIANNDYERSRLNHLN